MAHANITGELAAELAAVASQSGCELLHAEFQGGTLRLLLDRPDGEGGVTLADCERVSREVSALLDVTDFGRDRYTLEVSSPGLDRPLYGPKDYERFRGHLARITRVEPQTRAKETIVVRLEDFCPGKSGEDGEVTVTEADEGRRHTIALGDIVQARLEIEL